MHKRVQSLSDSFDRSRKLEVGCPVLFGELTRELFCLRFFYIFLCFYFTCGDRLQAVGGGCGVVSFSAVAYVVA